MALINYAGKLPIAVVLVWKGETIASPISNARTNCLYVVANESVTEFAIRATAGSPPLVITRKAKPNARLFDSALNTYTTLPVDGPALDALLAQSNPGGTLDLTFSYRTFFDKMLEQCTRGDSDPHNLANPNDSKAILDTFTHAKTGGVVRIQYKSATEKLVAVPWKLVDKEITPRPGRPPAVKLVLELDFLTGVDAARREAMRKLIAMDWSKLARYGSGLGQDYVRVWRENLYSFLVNQSDLARGERFRQAIIGRHRGKSAAARATDLRADIDRHLITANHWGEARESMTSERHQRLISDLFGTLHQQAWYASPVAYIRDFGRDFALDVEKRAALTLLYGAGHCGEHARVSYSILCAIIRSAGSKITHAIMTGNANIDHAFVVYDLDVREVIWTKATAANNSRMRVGAEAAVWNLREAIATSAKPGYVMDPYLDPSVMKSTAAELLAALNSNKRRAQGKDTDFLHFGLEHPSSYTTVDLRSQSEAERRAKVKHV